LSEFSGKKWTNYIESMIQKWEEFHMYFFDHYKPKQIHLLRYENLKTDLIPELRKLMNFLGVGMENENCVFKSQEGSAKRNKPDNIDLKQFFSKDQKKMYQTVMYKVYEELGLSIQN
jgi:hypothetical protein